MKRISEAALVVVLTAVCSGSTTVSAQDPYPPGSFELTPQVDLHLENKRLDVPQRFAGSFPSAATLRLPPGFEVGVFAAADLGNPRELVLGPDGVMYVADASGGGQADSKGSRVLALPDRDGDGVVDEVVVVADQLSMCYSIDFHDGHLYAAETHQVVRLVDTDGDGFYETHEVVVPDVPDVPPGAFHTSRNMAIDAVNERLFVQVGSPCDLCRQGEPVIGYNPDPLPQNPEFGTILVANLDGTGRRIFATGVRNVVGMDIHPLTGELGGRRTTTTTWPDPRSRPSGSISSAMATSWVTPSSTAGRPGSTSRSGTTRSCCRSRRPTACSWPPTSVPWLW
jgi:glucose/arabinose dehydrogenase